jgi:hypothetical protein
MKRVALLAILCSLFAFAVAQERDGSVLSNYHLTTSSMLNPAFTVDSKTYMQLNLVGVNVGMYNNLMQLTNVSVPSLVRSLGTLPSYESIKSNNKKYLYAAVIADAPSFYISKGRMGAGLFIRGRSVVDVRKVPYQITDLIVGLTDLETIESLDIKAKNAKVANMTWLEYGGNFGYMIKHRAYDIISIGGNLKYITGLNLQYAVIKNLEASYVPSVSIVADISGVYRSSAFAWRAGSGFGADLGITFKRMLKQVDSYKAHTQKSVSKCRPIDYEFKIGASLRDIGFIGFKKGTSIMQMQGSGTLDNDENIQEELDSKFSVSTTTGTKIRASLPLALNLHGDYNFGYHFYAGAIVQKALSPNSVTGVMASDFISLVPRYERKNIEIAVPLSFKRYTQPELGLALRFRSLLIGVDNILPFIKSSNVKAFGVYFNLGWSLFKNPKCNFGTKKIDDCSRYKSGKTKVKFKSSLLRAQPIKEKTPKKKKSRKPKLKLRLFKRH